jgi:hypothetical protein
MGGPGLAGPPMQKGSSLITTYSFVAFRESVRNRGSFDHLFINHA